MNDESQIPAIVPRHRLTAPAGGFDKVVLPAILSAIMVVKTFDCAPTSHQPRVMSFLLWTVSVCATTATVSDFQRRRQDVTDDQSLARKERSVTADRALSDKALKGVRECTSPHRVDFPAESIRSDSPDLDGINNIQYRLQGIDRSEQDVTGKLARCRVRTLSPAHFQYQNISSQPESLASPGTALCVRAKA
jgi:hypothetical protein